jgi:hypothetical protein
MIRDYGFSDVPISADLQLSLAYGIGGICIRSRDRTAYESISTAYILYWIRYSTQSEVQFVGYAKKIYFLWAMACERYLSMLCTIIHKQNVIPTTPPAKVG